MSRSLHFRHHIGEWCPFLLEDPCLQRHIDGDCGVASADHPGGVCPFRTIGRAQVREGDLTVTRHAPPSYGRRFHGTLWTELADADNRTVRRATRVALNGLAGQAAAAAAEQWDDGLLLPVADPGLEWEVC